MSEPSELPPDVHTVDLWIDGRFARRMSREVFEEERAVAQAVMPLLHEGLKYFEQTDIPPPALHGPSSSVPPNRTLVEDERVARDLVPLVRAAADVLKQLPQACQYHGAEFEKSGMRSGLPKCESCQLPYRVHKILTLIEGETHG